MIAAPTQSHTRLDPMLSGISAALVLVGLVAIASASVGYGEWHFNNPWHHTVRHGIYLALAICMGAVAYRVPVEVWQKTSGLWLLLALALLMLVLVPGVGRNVNGSQRWLPMGPLTVQPSEVVKFALVIYMSSFLVRHAEAVQRHWQGMAKPVAILGVTGLLLLMEPDFGATVICTGTVFGMLFLGGARLSYVLLLVCTAIGALVVMIVSAPYRLQRLTAYTDPWQDPFGSGFQLIQSLHLRFPHGGIVYFQNIKVCFLIRLVLIYTYYDFFACVYFGLFHRSTFFYTHFRNTTFYGFRHATQFFYL